MRTPTTAEARRRYAGPPLFSFGFRPFFLAAAPWAAVAAPVWVLALTQGDGTVGGLDGRAWHAHEMLFGYLGGVIAGFLLTAIPNWTGRLPVAGAPPGGPVRPVAGRAGGAAGPGRRLGRGGAGRGLPDRLAAVVWREILAARNRRNLPVAVMVSALAVANLAFHLQTLAPDVGPGASRAAVAVIVALVALIGGRVTSSFTQNWLLARGMGPAPAPFGPFDRGTLVLTVAALAAWTGAPTAGVTGALLALAGLANLAGLSRWRGWRAWREPLVWILHAGYLWVGLGLGLLGLAALAPAVPADAGLHALTAGAMGVMTLAMMTRAALGHTGRPRVADRATTAIYAAALLAALLRVAAPFQPDLHAPLLGGSVSLWSAAFAGYVLRYGPMLVRRAG